MTDSEELATLPAVPIKPDADAEGPEWFATSPEMTAVEAGGGVVATEREAVDFGPPEAAGDALIVAALLFFFFLAGTVEEKEMETVIFPRDFSIFATKVLKDEGAEARLAATALGVENEYVVDDELGATDKY